MRIEQGFRLGRRLAVLRFLPRDGRARRSGGGSEGFERFNGGGGGGDVGDVVGGVVAASAADFVFDFLDSSAAAVELLGVGVVPARETEFRGSTVSGRVRVNGWGKYG